MSAPEDTGDRRSDAGDSFGDWQSEDEDAAFVSAVDPARTLPSIDAWWSEVSGACGQDIWALVKALPFHERVRAVNLVRRELARDGGAARVGPALADGSALTDDALLAPVLADDMVLRHLEDEDDDWGDSDDDAPAASAAGGGAAAAAAAGPSAGALQAEIARLRALVGQLSNEEAPVGARGDGGEEAVGAPPSTQAEADASYFNSYGHYGIHLEMLQDRPRTEYYRACVEAAVERLGEAATVVDIGCGSGILSLFAARAGAGQVFAVDQSDILYEAIAAVERNGFSGTVHCLRGSAESVALPGATQADLVVSEWMGYGLLYENMLPSVLTARDRLLRPGGMMAPDRARLLVSGIRAEGGEVWTRRIGYWADVYGFDMEHMRAKVAREPAITVVPAGDVCTQQAVLQDWDLLACEDKDLDFAAEVTLTAPEACSLGGLCVAFDTLFEGRGKPGAGAGAGAGATVSPPLVLATGPDATPTHWQQAVLWLPDAQALALEAGAEVRCRMTWSRLPHNRRHYRMDVSLDVPGRDAPLTQTYLLE